MKNYNHLMWLLFSFMLLTGSQNTYSQNFYSQSGSDPSFQSLINNKTIQVGRNTIPKIPASSIDVNNSVVEVGPYANNSIKDGIRIHTPTHSNIQRKQFSNMKRWYQEDGNTQVFRLFKGDRNVRNTRKGAGRSEAFDPTVQWGRGKWHEWVGTYTIIKPLSCSIFQAKNNKSQWSVMINMSRDGDIVLNHRRSGPDITIAKKMVGKPFHLRVRDNGHNYEVYLNGTKVGEGHFDRPEGTTRFRWGMYKGGDGDVVSDAMILVTGAAVDAKNTTPIAVNKPNIKPLIAISNPTKTSFSSNEKIYVKVNANDIDGSINNVKLYVDNKLIRIESGSPYEWGHAGSPNPNELSNLTPGKTYTLKAVAEDNKGETAEKTMRIQIKAENKKPVVSFGNFPNEVKEGYKLSLSANASDQDGSITKVALYINNNLVREEMNSPYEWGHAGSPNPNELNGRSTGEYRLKLVATDNSGATSETTKVLIIRKSSGGGTTTTTTKPSECVALEQNGVVAVEAEAFTSQSKTNDRKWYVQNGNSNTPKPDPDGSHANSSSKGGYLEILPDTRVTHDDKLINGVNFTNEGGKAAVLNYKVKFKTAGKYYVWVRAYSTGTEDNGVHVGLNGKWPNSGNKMQWCSGKNQWTWESKQRTDAQHCGVAQQIYLNIPSPGVHTISFSMREDGFEFDKFVLSKSYTKPSGNGPEMVLTDCNGGNGGITTGGENQNNNDVKIDGELKKWHKVSLTFNGPNTSETASNNPFLNYRLNVTFTHQNGKSYKVPGYFAADGNAAQSSANKGNKWRVHFAPDEIGKWSYKVSFRKGNNVAVNDSNNAGSAAGFMDGKQGSFNINPSDKFGRDFRGKGRLQYVGEHYLKFAETGEYMIKQGPDSPENLFAYDDFDNTPNDRNRRKNYKAHIRDWKSGNPTWKNGKGKGLIGAVNYIASEGLNSMSFLTMNINGDDKNVYPYVNQNKRTQMDVSKLDQWAIVIEHMQKNGIFAHFKTQETENEMLLDNGNTGTERKLYYRELIARFGHNLALNWNLGEENGIIGDRNQNTAQRKSMAQYFWDHDPYRHHTVIHDGKLPDDLLGNKSRLTGFSLQTNRDDFGNVFRDVKEWIDKSRNAGKKWPVACDEPGDARHALRPDNDAGSSHTDGRKNGLWGALLAGAWGNEWYFGYHHDHSDLSLQDFRSRDKWWDYTRYALQFFDMANLPLTKMRNNNGLSSDKNSYCFAQPGQAYVVYLKNGGTTKLNLNGQSGTYQVKWFDPRNGGNLKNGSVTKVNGGTDRSLGNAPNNGKQDWVILITKGGTTTPNENTKPSVAFKTPTSNPRLESGYKLEVEVNATDDDGNVKHVDLFINNKLVRREVNAPYNWGHAGSPNPNELNGLSDGSYNIRAVATDDDGATAETTFTLTIGEDKPKKPSVRFATQTKDLTVKEGYKLEVEALATDQDGTIEYVELYIGKDLVRRENTAPYNWGYTDADATKMNSLAPGNYTVKAIATDNDGLKSETSFKLTVQSDRSSAPNVSFKTATNNVLVTTGNPIEIEVLATDQDGTIKYVELFINDDLVRRENIAPYTWGYIDEDIQKMNSLKPGSYTIKAIATDNDGNEGETSFDIIIEEDKPRVNTIRPIHDAYMQGATRFNTTELRTESGKRLTYLMFDLNEIDGVVTSAELRLSVATDVGQGPINIYLGNGTNWTEGNLSNSNKPVKGKQLASKNTVYRLGATYIWNLNTIPLDQKISLIVEHASGNDVSFWSKEGVKKPELMVTTQREAKANIINLPITEDIVGKVYPVPARDNIFLRELPNQPRKVEIYSINGAKIISKEFTNRAKYFSPSTSIDININELNTGRFIMKIYLEDKSVIDKHFIKR